MNLLAYRGRLLGLILATHEPNTWYIVVEDHGNTFKAVMIAKFSETKSQFTYAYDFSIGDEFVRVVPLSEFQRLNPDGWSRFQAQFRKIASGMEESKE